MKLIDNQSYKEYQDLKRWAQKEKVWKSVRSVTRLEDDIDLPIKKCVAMCALLGWEPVFSCCGFDYEGQPYHKYHQYDRPYIQLRINNRTEPLLKREFGGGWFPVLLSLPGKLMAIEFRHSSNPSWRDRECIHFPEEMVLGISYLEKTLSKLEMSFQDSAILDDSNDNYKKNGIRFWQYVPKDSWVVYKNLLDTY